MTLYRALAWSLDGQEWTTFPARLSLTAARADAQLSGFPLSLVQTLKG